MLSVKRDDYLIIKQGKKKTLVKVRSTKEGIKVCIDKPEALNKNTAEYLVVDESEVIANLGTAPEYGSAYGVKIEPILSASTVDDIPVHYYRALSDKEKTLVEKHLKTVLKSMRAENAALDKGFYITIKPNSSKMVGFYKHFSKKEKDDELCLKPAEISSATLPYLIHHEYAHGLWFTRMSPEWQAKWVNAYTKNITLSVSGDNQLKNLRVHMLEHRMVSKFNGQLDEENKILLKECLRFIKRRHSLLPRHLNMLMAGGFALEDLWPKSKIDIQHKNIVVSEYAMTMPDEFFAEAFAISKTDTTVLPKSVAKLLRRTLAAIKAGMSSEDMEDNTNKNDEE